MPFMRGTGGVKSSEGNRDVVLQFWGTHSRLYLHVTLANPSCTRTTAVCGAFLRDDRMKKGLIGVTVVLPACSARLTYVTPFYVKSGCGDPTTDQLETPLLVSCVPAGPQMSNPVTSKRFTVSEENLRSTALLVMRDFSLCRYERRQGDESCRRASDQQTGCMQIKCASVTSNTLFPVFVAWEWLPEANTFFSDVQRRIIYLSLPFSCETDCCDSLYVYECFMYSYVRFLVIERGHINAYYCCTRFEQVRSSQVTGLDDYIPSTAVPDSDIQCSSVATHSTCVLELLRRQPCYA